MNVNDTEISLLDLLIVVAENLKLLILGPVVAGLLAFGYAFTLPPSYKSQAILAVPAPQQAQAQQAVALMTSPLVLDPVVESLDLAAGSSKLAARVGLADQVKVELGKDGLLRLDVTAGAPAQAQMISNAIIDSWLKTTVPDEQERADLAARLDYAKKSLASVRQLLDRMVADGEESLRKPLTRGDTGSIVTISELQSRYFNEVLTISRTLKGLTREVVRQPPTLPGEPVSAKKGIKAVIAALVTGFALLLWVFFRLIWIGAARDSAIAEKLAKLRVAMGFMGRLRQGRR